MEILVTFFGTMFAGALTLVCVAIVCWIHATSNAQQNNQQPEVNAHGFWNWLDSLKIVPCGNDGIAAHGIGALILLSFGIGIFAEGMTDYMTDSESPQLLALAIDSEGEHRFHCLFKETTNNWTRTSIGREIFETEHGKKYVAATLGTNQFLDLGSITKADNPADHWVWRKSKRTFDRIRGIDPLKNVFGAVNGLYYPAKNWASGQEFYSRELESLQMRIDWSRTTFLIVVTIPLLTLAFIWLRPSAWDSVRATLTRTVAISSIIVVLVKSGGSTVGFLIAFAISLSALAYIYFRPSQWKFKATKRLALLFMMVVTVAIASRQGYAQFEDQFNERAFGYFMSHLQREFWMSKNPVKEGASERLIPFPKSN